ncbi:hypothetical protein P7J40_10745, partial [Streptococcus suis]
FTLTKDVFLAFFLIDKKVMITCFGHKVSFFSFFCSNKLSLFSHHKKEGLILLSQSVQGKENVAFALQML